MRSLAVVGLATATACGSSQATGGGSATVSPSSAAATPTGSPTISPACTHGGPTYMVQPYAPTEALAAAYKPVIASLSRTLGCKVRFEIAGSLADELNAVAGGHVAMAEFAGLGPGFALNATTPGIDMVATYNSAFDGTPAMYSTTLYQPARQGLDLSGLVGRTVALSTPGSITGDDFPRAAMIEAGVLSKVSVVYTGSQRRSLLDLSCPARPADRRQPCTKYAFAAIGSQVTAPSAKAHQWDPQKFDTLWRSDPIPYTAIGLNAQLAPQVRKDLQAALLAIPAANVRPVAKLLNFASARTGRGLVQVSDGTYCHSSNLDLCDVIKTLKLKPAQVLPLVGEGL